MRIRIAVSSSYKFYEKTIPVVLKSLLDAYVPKEDITIFINASPEYKVEIQDGVEYRFLNFSCLETAPLLEIAEKHLESDYWFLLHDTTKVGPRFTALLYNIPENKPEKIALRTSPSMNMGSYRYDYLLNIQDKLESIRGYDFTEESLFNWKQWSTHNEDIVLWRHGSQPEIYNNIPHLFYITEHNNWYSDTVPRRTEYYPALDLYKNKSNWGQSQTFTIKL